MIIDNIYINQDQITKISYDYYYNKSPEMEFYKLSKFSVACINDEKIQFFKVIDGLFKKADSIYPFRDRNYYLSRKKEIQNKAPKEPKNIKNVSGFIKVFIELSSGTIVETKICEFEDKVEIEGTVLGEEFRKTKFGIKFNPKELNIDFVCDILFQNKKQSKKEKVMI